MVRPAALSICRGVRLPQYQNLSVVACKSADQVSRDLSSLQQYPLQYPNHTPYRNLTALILFISRGGFYRYWSLDYRNLSLLPIYQYKERQNDTVFYRNQQPPYLGHEKGRGDGEIERVGRGIAERENARQGLHVQLGRKYKVASTMKEISQL